MGQVGRSAKWNDPGLLLLGAWVCCGMYHVIGQLCRDHFWAWLSCLEEFCWSRQRIFDTSFCFIHPQLLGNNWYVRMSASTKQCTNEALIIGQATWKYNINDLAISRFKISHSNEQTGLRRHCRLVHNWGEEFRWKLPPNPWCLPRNNWESGTLNMFGWLLINSVLGNGPSKNGLI